MTDMPPSTAVFAFNTVFKTMEVFATYVDATVRVPGLEIAEGDWLFFAGDGSSLNAVYSVDPFVRDGGYSNGVYDLHPGEGPNLMVFLFDMCRGTDGIWMWPFEELKAYFDLP